MLDRMVANRLPKKVGRTMLAHVLTHKGGVASEFTITRLAEDRFYIISAANANRHDWDLLQRNAPRDGSVRLDNVTLQNGVLVVAGPKSRELMQKVTDTDMSGKAFPWLSGRQIDIGWSPCLALRVNFVGELGWELHHPLVYQNAIWDALWEAGKEFDMRPFGIRAMDSLRIEKSYKYWRADLTTEYNAWEAGLDRFVHLNKGEFIGREALVRQQQEGVKRKLITLECQVKDADPWGNEPVYAGDKMVGRATTGAYGHTMKKSYALAYLDAAHSAPGTKLEIVILDQRLPCVVVPDSPWDPENERLRA